MAKTVKLGVVGCGVAAMDFILPNLVQPQMKKKDVELTGVCDTDERRAKKAMKLFRAKGMYTDFRDMLDHSDINAVAILTPVASHFPIALESAHAGKHVYVQKAMTTSLKEASSLLSTVQKEGVKLVASPGQMHNPSLRMAKENLDRGLIGSPLWGHIFASKEGHLHERTDPTWYYRPGGGPLYTYLVYLATTFCAMLGAVQNVTAFSGIAIPTRTWKDLHIDSRMDDSSMLLMDFGKSTFVSAISNFCVKDVMHHGAIYGTNGVIHFPLSVFRSTQHSSTHVRLSNFRRRVSRLLRGSSSATRDWVEWTPPLFTFPYPLAAPWGANIMADILEFVDCIKRNRAPTIATGEHARHIIEVFEKAYLAAYTGKTQRLETTF